MTAPRGPGVRAASGSGASGFTTLALADSPDLPDWKEILETGVGILEYDGGVSYHGKCFVMDGRLSGIGSFNWDMRSAYLDTELMLVIDSEDLNADLRREMAEYERETLTVLDDNTVLAPEGMTAQKDSLTERALRGLLSFFAGWARFLM